MKERMKVFSGSLDKDGTFAKLEEAYAAWRAPFPDADIISRQVTGGTVSATGSHSVCTIVVFYRDRSRDGDVEQA